MRLLIGKGADVHRLTYGGHTPYHLTYGRTNGDIQKSLFEVTAPHLRELPESESEDSDEYCDDSDDGEVRITRAYTSMPRLFQDVFITLFCVHSYTMISE